MNRRDFIRCAGGCACLTAFTGPFLMSRARAEDSAGRIDTAARSKLADLALNQARAAGASYADFRLATSQYEFVSAREDHIDATGGGFDGGFFVRVMLNGTWGYSSSSLIEEAEVARVTTQAVTMARSIGRIQSQGFELEELPIYQESWVMPMKTDPFEVKLEDKTAKILGVNHSALAAGANYVNSMFTFVREKKYFASSRGSRIEQTRVRVLPDVSVTIVDKASGRFVSCDSSRAPRGSGYEYIDEANFVGEAPQLVEAARQKLGAKPVEPGVYDLVLDPTHLWLVIHESVGHATELDRALGWEAGFAGTTFVKPDQRGKLQYGSPLMHVVADRSQLGGLSTVGFDDDGLKTTGSEFDVIKDGVFQNFQMAIGQAQLIGLKQSNGCAFADSWRTFPIQRMPNVSLQPNPQPCKKDDLFSGIQKGIYIQGNGSWSIDQQRHNFQFGGQRFFEIKDGKLGEPLRDVAYQGSTVPFWHSLDGLGDASTYYLGGAPNCGKGQPEQTAPVSHGCPLARFRQVNVLNTGKGAI